MPMHGRVCKPDCIPLFEFSEYRTEEHPPFGRIHPPFGRVLLRRYPTCVLFPHLSLDPLYDILLVALASMLYVFLGK